MSVQIYVGNLNYRMTDESLRAAFEPYGEVTSAKIVQDRETGRSKGFGFIEMANADDADRAIAALNDKEVSGRNLKVNLARPKNY